MSENSSQFVDFLRLYLRLRPNARNIALIAGAVALLVTLAWYLSYSPTFTSGAIALVRPQQTEQSPDDEKNGHIASLFPKPLGVPDYTVLMKSDAILTAVADTYNERYANDDPDLAVNAAGLRVQLNATSRLEIKTPYAVSYYPTIEMSAFAYAPESAAALMDVWIDQVKEKAHEITFSTKEDVFVYLEKEYTKERDTVYELQQELNSAMREGGTLIEALRLERAQLEERYEVETIAQLDAAEDEWDAKIAARESELNLPLTGEQVYAATDRLKELKQTVDDKVQQLAEARARLDIISCELKLYKDAPIADPESEFYWTLGVQGSAKDAPKESDITEVQVPSTRVSPIAVLLSRDASKAKVDIESLPKELDGVNESIADTSSYIEQLQTQYVLGDTELVGLMRKKTDRLKTITIERGYGLENLQRESELLIANLTRERQAIEERLKRDLETKLSVFASLAESRLQARLAVANTIDEFQIITGPSQPEGRVALRVFGFFLVTFVLMTALITGGYIAVFVVTDTLRNLGLSAESKS